MAELITRPRVAVTGASGYIGNAFVERFRERYEIVGLSRTERPSHPERGPARWRECDLYNLRQVEDALEGCDVAIYLVHSMSPSARLTQANFADIDLILADNFARGAAKVGVKHILYVGGLLPSDEDEDELSKHLASRKEVEDALGGHGVPVTALRAGLVVGPGGSSFQILQRLVARLPIMLCPAWTRTETHPIALDDLVELLGRCIDAPEVRGKVWDVGGPNTTTYLEMIADVAALMGRRRLLFPVRWFSPGLSRLWVSLITGYPRALVRPLVQSLEHRMVPRDRALQAHFGLAGTPWQEAARDAFAESTTARNTSTRAQRRVARRSFRAERTVRSVQRLPRPQGADAQWVAAEYLRWLPRFMRPVLSTEREGDRVDIKFRLMRRPLLALRFAPDRSSPDRALFRVEGGILATKPARGRLEFRLAPNGLDLIAAIHEFVPRLPWYLYVVTQAIAHLFVMWRFGVHLARARPALPPSPQALGSSYNSTLGSGSPILEKS